MCFLFYFKFFLQLLCISLVPLISPYSAHILILPAERSPQKSLILLEILPAEFIQAYFMVKNLLMQREHL